MQQRKIKQIIYYKSIYYTIFLPPSLSIKFLFSSFFKNYFCHERKTCIHYDKKYGLK